MKGTVTLCILTYCGDQRSNRREWDSESGFLVAEALIKWALMAFALSFAEGSVGHSEDDILL